MNTPAPIDKLATAQLTAYLAAHLSGFSGPLKIRKFAGGQSNPTFLLESASGKYVLRRKPPGEVLKSAHAVDREFRVISALAATDLPVAKAIHLCSDENVIGSMFYLMSYVPGRVFWDATLPELHAEQRPAVYDAMNRTLASLHSLNVHAIGLGDYGKPGNYFERQISMWARQYQLSETRHIPAMDFMLDWLPRNTPRDDGRICLLHGDFRIDNMIFHPGKSEVLALIDWELSTLGHPMADLAFHCMSMRLPSLSEMKGLGGKDRAKLNIPSEEAFIAAYCERTGVSRIEDWHFYMAFSYFRLAAIVQGVMKRALDGNASSQKALEVGKMAGPLAEMAAAVLATDKKDSPND